MDLSSVTSWRAATQRADLATLATTAGETVVAGGTWLFSEPQPDVTGLVDLTTLGWPAVEAAPGGGVRVAATCSIEELVAAAEDGRLAALGAGPSVAALVRDAAESLLMSPKIWHTATVGGNVCLGLPAGAMTSLAVALDAEAVVWTADGGERREPVATFVQGARVTALAPGEVLRGLDVPAASLAATAVLRRVALTTYGRTAALVTARRDPDGTVVLGATGSLPRPAVLRSAGTPGPAEVDAWVDGLGADPGWYDDAHGAPDWRAAMTRRLAHEAVAAL
ncbi:MAG: FAD-binding molybdopterin dehydrogenase [Nocardioides sp.]|nr:FAD-binding molybdopterin dehydrogenase [Nocardioides sp.]